MTRDQQFDCSHEPPEADDWWPTQGFDAAQAAERFSEFHNDDCQTSDDTVWVRDPDGTVTQFVVYREQAGITYRARKLQ